MTGPQVLLQWTVKDVRIAMRMVGQLDDAGPDIAIERQDKDAMGAPIWMPVTEKEIPPRTIIHMIGGRLLDIALSDGRGQPSDAPPPLTGKVEPWETVPTVRAWAKHILQCKDIGCYGDLDTAESREAAEHYRNAYVQCANMVLALIGTDP